LERLPPEIISMVFTNLEIKDFLNLAACSKTLYDVSLLDSVWRELIQKTYGIERGSYNKYSARQYFEKLLYPYHKMLGYWTLDDVSFYGGLMKVSLEQGSGDIVCQEIFAPRTCELLQDDVQVEGVFRISLSDDETCGVRFTCLRNLASRYHTKPPDDAADGERESGSDGNDKESGSYDDKRKKETFLVQLLNIPGYSSSTLSISCRACCACTYQGTGPPLEERRDLRFLPDASGYLFHPFARMRNPELRLGCRFQYSIKVRKISLTSHPPPPTLGLVDTGVFKGSYSAHEVELILFQYATSAQSDENGAIHHVIQGLKLTGDPNIPAGKITFRANLKDRIVLSSAQDNLNVDLLRNMDCCDEIEDTPQPFASPFFCDVPDFDFPKTCIARLKAQVQVAAHEYTSPSMIDAHLVVFSQNICALMMFDFEHIMLFERVQGLVDV